MLAAPVAAQDPAPETAAERAALGEFGRVFTEAVNLSHAASTRAEFRRARSRFDAAAASIEQLSTTRQERAHMLIGVRRTEMYALAGNVFKVLVGPGDAVSAGQTILVVEAMKMETDVSAPRDGTVSAVHVTVGDTVAVGDPLLSLD